MYIFFFNDTATTEIYTLSLHDALPIFDHRQEPLAINQARRADGLANLLLMKPFFGVLTPDVEPVAGLHLAGPAHADRRSEEHTSELQSRQYLVCRLLLEKKKPSHKTPT